jgi:hypothetical protein
MYTKLLLLLIISFSFTIKSTGVSTQCFLQLIHRDCYNLQNNLDTLSTYELQQGLSRAKSGKYDPDSTPLPLAIAMTATIFMVKNPQFLGDLYHSGYMPIMLGTAAAAGWYMNSRNQILDQTSSIVAAELIRRENNGQREIQRTNMRILAELQQEARRLADLKNVLKKLSVIKEKPPRQH